MTPEPHRRALLRLTALVATSGLAVPTDAALSSAAGASPALADAHRLWARLNADLSGRTVFFTTFGDVWGFRPQADDLSLDDFAKRGYGYAGVAALRVVPRGGDGALVVREKSWAFYRDPLTGRLGDRIANLWTGVVDTAPPLSGPTRERVLGAEGGDPYRMQVRRIGERAFVSTAAVARFRPRDTTWFKLEANLGSHHCAARDLDDPALDHVPGTYSQNLVAEWQTWTGMHGEPGHILFKGDGVPLRRLDEMPRELKDAIEGFFPRQLDEVAGWA